MPPKARAQVSAEPTTSQGTTDYGVTGSMHSRWPSVQMTQRSPPEPGQHKWAWYRTDIHPSQMTGSMRPPADIDADRAWASAHEPAIPAQHAVRNAVQMHQSESFGIPMLNCRDACIGCATLSLGNKAAQTTVGTVPQWPRRLSSRGYLPMNKGIGMPFLACNAPRGPGFGRA